jgi:tripartite-type tricarboxylate transporter receptor subunit TctC
MKKILLALAFLTYGSAFAAESLKIIVPYAAGGNTDLLARIFAKEIDLRQHIDVVVVNKPGAEGLIGQNDLLTKEPDGNTILFTGNGGIVFKSLESAILYENMKKLVPIARVAISGNILVTKKSSKIKTWDQFQAALKAGTVSIGTNGTPGRTLIEEMFPNNPNVIIVPYNADAPTALGLLSGTVDVAVVTFVYNTQVADGEMNALAVTTPTSQFGIKSLRELGVNAVRQNWTGVFAPPGTNEVTQARLHKIITEAQQSAELQKAVTTHVHAIISRALKSNEFATSIETEYRQLVNTVKYPNYNK